MLTDELILNLLNEHMGEIKKFGVKKIGLFGSYSRMVQNEESDNDIIALSNTFSKPDQVFLFSVDFKM